MLEETAVAERCCDGRFFEFIANCTKYRMKILHGKFFLFPAMDQANRLQFCVEYAKINRLANRFAGGRLHRLRLCSTGWAVTSLNWRCPYRSLPFCGRVGVALRLLSPGAGGKGRGAAIEPRGGLPGGLVERCVFDGGFPVRHKQHLEVHFTHGTHCRR